MIDLTATIDLTQHEWLRYTLLVLFLLVAIFVLFGPVIYERHLDKKMLERKEKEAETGESHNAQSS
ncbi:MAG TPA: hypothetical protein DCR21_05030 [Succinivibrionaceae bacterium]|nr:hypothetical protein [Succinivibrionaceae bacterium]